MELEMIDLHELARIEKQALPTTVSLHLDTLNRAVNAGLQALREMSDSMRLGDTMRKARLNRAIASVISPSKSLYEAAQLARQLVHAREQNLHQQLTTLHQLAHAHIPAHETELQQQLAHALLAEDNKAADKALDGLQTINQRRLEQGELATRAAALTVLLTTLKEINEILRLIETRIEPSLWLKQAENLRLDYQQHREQLAAFIQLHHQIRACERLGQSAMTAQYVSPLGDTLKLLEFDTVRHNQAVEALRSQVYTI